MSRELYKEMQILDFNKLEMTRIAKTRLITLE